LGSPVRMRKHGLVVLWVCGFEWEWEVEVERLLMRCLLRAGREEADHSETADDETRRARLGRAGRNALRWWW
jgi:hypothetical protein